MHTQDRNGAAGFALKAHGLKDAEVDELQKHALTISEVYEVIGWGHYQWRLFVFCAVMLGAESIEVTLISWLTSEFMKPGFSWHLNKNTVALLGIGVFAGELVGSMILGPLADRIGRKPVLCLANVGILLLGLACVFAPDFKTLLFLRCTVGFFVGALPIGFDLLIESIPEENVNSANMAMNYFWSFGALYLNCAAPVLLEGDLSGFDYLGQAGAEPWRLLTLMAAVPFLLVIGLCFLLEESPKWLLAHGHRDEALRTLHRIAASTGKPLPKHLRLQSTDDEAPSDKSPFCELFSHEFAPRTIVLMLVWLVCVAAYYGVTLITPMLFESGGSQHYGAVLFGTSGELLGTFVTIQLMNRFGYIQAHVIVAFAAGVATVFLTFYAVVPTSMLMVIDFVARGVLLGQAASIYVITPLAYPTRIRATAHCFFFAVARAGCMTSTAPVSTATALNVSALACFASSGLIWWIRNDLGEKRNSEIEDKKVS